MLLFVREQLLIQPVHIILEEARFTKENGKAVLFEKADDICLRSQLIRAALVREEIMACNANILGLLHHFSHARKRKPLSTLDVHLEEIYP